MSEQPSKEASEQSEFNEDEFIDELLAEDNEHEETVVENPDLDTEKSVKNITNTKLPVARIKSIMKLDPDINLVSQESAFLVARATEMFIEKLAQETYFYTVKAKRKTVQRKDVDAAIENIETMCFLEGALD